MLVFGKLAQLIPPEVPVLSGYLGDVTVGKHLGEGALDDDGEVLTRFLTQNRAILNERSETAFQRLSRGP